MISFCIMMSVSLGYLSILLRESWLLDDYQMMFYFIKSTKLCYIFRPSIMFLEGEILTTNECLVIEIYE